MKLILFSIAIALLTAPARAKETDRYTSYTDLAAHEIEGTAYHVVALNRRSSITIMAIHGGKIEAGSGELAREVAGSDFDLYIFSGDLPANNRRLHVTSTHFNDPRALALVNPAKVVISLHGYKDTERDAICVGGGNSVRRDRMTSEIEKSGLGFEIVSQCKEIGGTGAANIVNEGQEPGVQLEMSTHLRDRLLSDKELMKKFAALIRVEALRP